MFLENLWYCAALSTEITRQPFRRVICGKLVVFYRKLDGSPVALEDRCPHRQAPLSMGHIVEDDIVCGYHGLVFNSVGKCVHVPHQHTIPAKASIQAYPSVERWGFIWLWYGDPTQADDTLIPNLPWTTDPRRSPVYFYNYVRANHQLMADNLLDLSHVNYLHASTIGSRNVEQDDLVNSLTTEVEGDRVKFVRRMINVEPAPFARAWGGFKGRVNRTNYQEWLPPNTILIRLEIEDEINKVTVNHDHFMTPETDTTCHYFMDWTRDFAIDGGYPTDSDVRQERNRVVRTEDIPIVEAQQEVINFLPEAKDVPLKCDGAISAVYRILARKYKEQRGDMSARRERSQTASGKTTKVERANEQYVTQ